MNDTVRNHRTWCENGVSKYLADEDISTVKA